MQLIGAAPEAYEAALLAAYPGRGNPVLDALTGDISIRELRIMLEHLPPGNPAYRELHGPWSDLEWLIYDVSSQIRLGNTNFSNLYRKEGTPAQDPEYLPTPDQWQDASTETETRPMEQVQAERDHLQNVLNRPDPR